MTTGEAWFAATVLALTMVLGMGMVELAAHLVGPFAQM